MKIYNSYTNKLEEFKSIEENVVKMYVCGPTVNGYAHVGNLMPTIFFDVVARYFSHLGYEVKYASNFTDINPKITAVALENGISEREVSEMFTAAYMKDTRDLNCKEVDYRPTALGTLNELIEFVSKLIDLDFAYEKNGNVYFRVSKLNEYGNLSNQSIEDLESGARLEVNDEKENPLDFALWRKTEEGENFDSPWSRGIPGWHSECVVMINSIFEGKIDIHGGGVDLKFPHHENEIAQSKACYNHNLANYWMHNGHINVEGVKMSKSLGNFVLIKDLITEYNANTIRIMMLKTHYRQPKNITDKILSDSKSIDEKVYNALKAANLYIQIKNIENDGAVGLSEFHRYMDDDFNTSNVITLLLDLVKKINAEVRNNGDVINYFNQMITIADVLGLNYELAQLDAEMVSVYKDWIKLREEKKYDEADRKREILVRNNML